MHRRSAVLLAAAPFLPLSAACVAAVAEPPTLRIGGFLIEPLVMGGPNEPVRGVLPDFIKREVAPHTRMRFEWMQPTSYARALKSLRDGSVDVLLFHSSRTDNLDGIGRFDFVYLESQPCLAVDENSKLREVRSLSDLAGLQISWVQGTIVPVDLVDVPIKWQWISGQNWQAVTLRMVKAGRIDAAYFANPISPAYVARKEQLAVRLLPLPMAKLQFIMLYSLSADKALVEEFGMLAKQAFKTD